MILISIDGFRADYFDRGQTPTLAALAAEGVRAGEGMRPSFPSLTFPNHYTLVTGRYPDHHGIVANTMEDNRIQPDWRFTLSNKIAVTDARWWDEATPIWVSAERQGVRTGTMFWPGSEAAIHGVRPSYYKAFDQMVPPEQRVDTVLGWLDLPPAVRPRFITLYFDQVDTAGHEHGPDSAEVNQALARTDSAIARLVGGLKQRGLFDTANIVVVADHGMAPISPEREVVLDDLVPPSAVHVVTTGAVAEIDPEGQGGDGAVQMLLAPHPHMSCWRKAEIPARLHYGANARIPPIVCAAEVGWTIETREGLARQKVVHHGEHGYDNAEPLMRALFLAHGPGFRKGVVAPAFDNVDVYPMLARVLGVKPETSDGRLADVADLLAPGPR